MVSLAVSRGCKSLVRNFMIYGGNVPFSVCYYLVSVCLGFTVWFVFSVAETDLTYICFQLYWFLTTKFRQEFHTFFPWLCTHLLSILHSLPLAPFCHCWASIRAVCFCLLSWGICKWGRYLNLIAALPSVKINFRPTFLASCIPSVEMLQ